MYVRDVLHLTEAEGAQLNSRFYFCFMLSRFVGGFITDFLGPFTMEYVIIPIGVTIYIVGFALGTCGLSILPFVGLFVSLYWPTVVITCTKYWGEESSIPSPASSRCSRASGPSSSICWGGSTRSSDRSTPTGCQCLRRFWVW